MKLNRNFILNCALIAIIISGFITFYIINNKNRAPFEDAAILMRYSQNLAKSGEIVWNLKESHVDGATDFLFMVIIAGMNKVGIPIEFSVDMINIPFFILTVIIIYIITKKISNNFFIAFIVSFYFSFNLGLKYLFAYFGTPFYTFWLFLMYYFFISIVLDFNKSIFFYYLFSLVSLITGLIRPESVLFILVLYAMQFLYLPRDKKIYVVKSLILFISLGSIYFLWHWYYFQYLLPNPYYIKGGGLHIDGLLSSLKYSFLIIGPFWLICTLPLNLFKNKKLLFILFVPIFFYILMWVLLSSEMNYGGRFQFPILPIFLLASIILLFKNSSININKSTLNNIVSFCLFIIFIVGYLMFIHMQVPLVTQDGREMVGKLLYKYKNKGYTIMLSEAGLIPFYSQWNTKDSWGLNDKFIAHYGLNEKYISDCDPEIIMFHADFSPITFNDYKKDYFKKIPFYKHYRVIKFNSMIDMLQKYAESNDYCLLGAYGISPYETHYYYLKKNFPDSASIIEDFKHIKYAWNGQEAINYAIFSKNVDLCF